jgi:hypothetical protein
MQPTTSWPLTERAHPRLGPHIVLTFHFGGGVMVCSAEGLPQRDQTGSIRPWHRIADPACVRTSALVFGVPQLVFCEFRTLEPHRRQAALTDIGNRDIDHFPAIATHDPEFYVVARSHLT